VNPALPTAVGLPSVVGYEPATVSPGREVACPGRFELPTYGLEGRCSIRAELRAACAIMDESAV
jgi:hypothetical protein